jgi:hypothetical protein
MAQRLASRGMDGVTGELDESNGSQERLEPVPA